MALGVGIFGLANGVTITPATTVVLNDLGVDKAGDASDVNQLGRQVGGVLGVAIVGSIFAGLYAGSLDSKIGRPPEHSQDLATCALFLVAGAVLAFLSARESPDV
ncbi:MAG: hypothetical protein JJE13_03240 [Thermoleophilia bacterium]|nr:hypothetical protein [Thermoleophilia bacterium]